MEALILQGERQGYRSTGPSTCQQETIPRNRRPEAGGRQKRRSPHARAPFASKHLYSYDVAPDGKRFLVNRDLKPDHVQPLTIVVIVGVIMPSIMISFGSGLPDPPMGPSGRSYWWYIAFLLPCRSQNERI